MTKFEQRRSSQARHAEIRGDYVNTVLPIFYDPYIVVQVDLRGPTSLSHGELRRRVRTRKTRALPCRVHRAGRSGRGRYWRRRDS